MSLGNVYYEVFVRRPNAAAFTLAASFASRENAVQTAQNLLATGEAKAVRVFKDAETDDDEPHEAHKIFEEGELPSAAPAGAKRNVTIPCAKPEDLYTAQGRRTVAHLLRDSLAGWGITAGELLHHPGHVQRLELAGTLLQHAVQKSALRLAATTGQPVQQLMIKLNELVTSASRRVVLDAREKKFPLIKEENFAKLCADLVDATHPDYLLNAAIAKHIAPTRGWDEKLFQLLALYSSLSNAGPGQSLGHRVIDALVAEILQASASLMAILGEQRDLGSALISMAMILQGRVLESKARSLEGLTKLFGAGELPLARTAFAGRILRELRGSRRLSSGNIEEELALMHKLADTLADCPGQLLTTDEVAESLSSRCNHLISAISLERHLADSEGPMDKLDRLLALEPLIVGATAKRELAAYLHGVLGSPRLQDFVLERRDQLLARFTMLASLQARILQSALPEGMRKQMAGEIEKIAVEARTKAAKTLSR